MPGSLCHSDTAMTSLAPDRLDPVTLRQQVAPLPVYVLKVWRTRYAATDGLDLQARAMLNQEAAAVRAGGVQPDALTLWIRLADKVVHVTMQFIAIFRTQLHQSFRNCR